jgi:TetR/AcrR family transcriptional repressor of nem operon
MKEAALGWSKNFRALLDDIAAVYPQRDYVDLDVVADICGSAMQGAIVIAKMQRI